MGTSWETDDPLLQPLSDQGDIWTCCSVFRGLSRLAILAGRIGRVAEPPFCGEAHLEFVHRIPHFEKIYLNAIDIIKRSSRTSSNTVVGHSVRQLRIWNRENFPLHYPFDRARRCLTIPHDAWLCDARLERHEFLNITKTPSKRSEVVFILRMCF